jgi:AraC-like DNA-binding protein
MRHSPNDVTPSFTILRKDHFADLGQPLIIERRDDQENLRLHNHEFAELTIITGGEGYHVTGGGEYLIGAGDVFHIIGKRSHGFQNNRKLSLVNILYDPEQIKIPSWDLSSLPGYFALMVLEPTYRDQHAFQSRLKLKPSQIKLVLGLVEKIEKEISERAPGSVFFMIAYFMQIIGMLSRFYSATFEPTSQYLLRIGESITLMENNHRQPIDLEGLARVAHLSKRQFQRVFQQAMGVSPSDYLMRIRLNRAMEMMHDASLSISEIGYASGFNDPNYFSRYFQKNTGFSPLRYRKQLFSFSRKDKK